MYLWSTHMAYSWIWWNGDHHCACRFSLPVSLDQIAAHGHFQELMHLWGQGSAPWNDESASSPQNILCFVEEKRIVYFMSASSICRTILQFHIETMVQGNSGSPWQFLKLLFYCLIEAIKKSRDTDKDCWPGDC